MVRDLHTLAIIPSFHIQEKFPYFSYFDCVYMSLKGNKALRLQFVEEILACDFFLINLALALWREFLSVFHKVRARSVFAPTREPAGPQNSVLVTQWRHNQSNLWKVFPHSPGGGSNPDIERKTQCSLWKKAAWFC